jgi:hypothetical protein
MYALINGEELLLGPISFNIRMINSELEDLEMDYRVNSSDYVNVPIDIGDGVKIIYARNDIPEHDPRFEVVSQLNHEIQENEVVFFYTKSDKTLEQIKGEYKQLVAPERRNKENTNIILTTNGVEITVSTSRDNRLALASKALGNSGPYNFKFGDTWVEITKADLEYILTQIDTKVQEAFDWELSKLNEIESCETKEAVYDIEIAPSPEVLPTV